MAEVKNCLLPEDVKYHVEFNVWLRPGDDGTWDIGMTDIAQTLAGSIIHCRPKKVGKKVKAGKGLATVESGKWVGPVRSPFACEVVARNDAIEGEATMLNRSPYKEGWIVRVRPAEDADLSALVDAATAVPAFAAYMAEHELEDCIHCEGFDG